MTHSLLPVYRELKARLSARTVLAVTVAMAAVGCAHSPAEPLGSPARETVLALTADHVLLRINAGQPQRVLASVPVRGLPAGEQLVGMDFRVARGVLYALGQSGQLYTLDATTGQLAAVGTAAPAVALRGTRFELDFNPAADRLRVVSDAGQNLRYHPDTGAVVDFDPQQPGTQPDPDLTFAQGDVQHGHPPLVLAAGYTYNQQNDKLTTNFAIDGRQGTLVVQGSREGVTPVVSPNLGVLRTVGPLGTGPLAAATLDISDVNNTALAALRTVADGRTRLYRLNLDTGVATLVGTVAGGQPLLGMAIEP